MKEHPLIVKLITSSLLLAPIVSVLIIYFGTRTYHVAASPDIILDFSLLSIGCFIVGYGVWKVRLWGFYLLLGLGAVVVGFDLKQIISVPKTLNLWDFIDVIMVFTGIFLITQKPIRALYFNHRLRWWERASRQKAEILGQFEVKDRKVDIPILDLSSSGCFVGTNIDTNKGEIINLNLTSHQIPFTSRLKVVRHSTTPKGTGLMFIDTSRTNKKNLKHLIKTLSTKRIGNDQNDSLDLH